MTLLSAPSAAAARSLMKVRGPGPNVNTEVSDSPEPRTLDDQAPSSGQEGMEGRAWDEAMNCFPQPNPRTLAKQPHRPK